MIKHKLQIQQSLNNQIQVAIFYRIGLYYAMIKITMVKDKTLYDRQKQAPELQTAAPAIYLL